MLASLVEAQTLSFTSISFKNESIEENTVSAI